MAGTTFQQVQKYEKGINRISASRLQQFADALQVGIVFFFEGLAGKKANGVGSKGEANESRALIDAFSRIKSKANRQKAIDLARTLANQ